MATSPPLGKHFSTRTASLAKLSGLTASPKVASVLNALQPLQTVLVGGIVRDCLLSKPTSDIDLACAGLPEQVTSLLTAANIHVVPTGLKHGTVTAVIDGEHIEITTFRAKTTSGVIGFGSDLTQDLLLRDFTINALAYDPSSNTLLDPCDGLTDLENLNLKAVGEAYERFVEDPLRILRMVRFGPAQNFSVDPKTRSDSMRALPLLSDVSPERIREEIKKIVLSPYAGNGFRFLAELGALQYTIPELIPSIKCEQNSWHHSDVFEHTMQVLDNAPNDLMVRLAAIFHDVGKPGTLSVGDDGERHFYKHELLSNDLCEQAMARLKFSGEEIKAVCNLVALHMRPIECGAPGARRLIRDLGDQFDQWVQLKRADAYGAKHDRAEFESRLDSFIQLTANERVRLVSHRGRLICLDGITLMEALGLKPGKKIGYILKQLEEAVLDDPNLNTPEKLLELAGKIVVPD